MLYTGPWTYSQSCSTTVLLASQEMLCHERNISAGTRTETPKPYTKFPAIHALYPKRPVDLFSKIHQKYPNEFI